MAGIVYLKTNRFEVTLEGITFRTKDFESLCTLDFLFAERKTWAHKPIVGIDIIRHPRNPKIILLLLCIGTGCVILRFHSGKALPDPILKFLRDDRINFVGFGIQEKCEILSLEELGLTKKKVDVGYLAAKRFNDSKYKRSKLGELARKILGIKKMAGLTDASSFERHEHIKCAICQLFITTVIGMTLLSSDDKKKFEDVPNKISSLSIEEWFNVPKVEKKEYPQLKTIVTQHNHNPNKKSNEGDQREKPPINKPPINKPPPVDGFVDDSVQSKYEGGFFVDLSQTKGFGSKRYSDSFLDQGKAVESKRYSDSFYNKRIENYSGDNSNQCTSGSIKTPLKGILKWPSINTNKLEVHDPSSSSNNTTKVQMRRPNSKGLNVSFAFT